MVDMKKYYFCYSTNLAKFIKDKGIEPICQAKHDKTDNRFWLFERTEELSNALKEFTERGRQLGLHDRD